MSKRISLSIISIFYLVFFFACAQKPVVIKSELDKLYEKNFEGLEIPDTDWIKEGESRSFPYKTFDEIWDASISELMQQGIIAHALKEKGVIVIVREPPFALYIEKGENNTVYINWMWDLYGRIIADHAKITKAFFDELALHLYCKDKWKYLFED